MLEEADQSPEMHRGKEVDEIHLHEDACTDVRRGIGDSGSPGNETMRSRMQLQRCEELLQEDPLQSLERCAGRVKNARTAAGLGYLEGNVRTTATGAWTKKADEILAKK